MKRKVRFSFAFRSFFRNFALMKQRMTIGFDAKRIVRNGTGLGSYGRTLVNDLARAAAVPEQDVCLRLYAPDAGSDDLRRQVEGRPGVSFCYAPASRIPFYKQLWRSRLMVGSLVADEVDVFHGLSGELPVGLKQSGIHSVVTIHDLIFLRHPEYYNWIDTKIYAWKFRQALREADHVVAISECTRRDILAFGDIDDSRVSLVYQSCSPRFLPVEDPVELQRAKAKYQLPDCFVLSVGSIEERKNLLLAVKALEKLPATVHLVAVGKSTAYVEKLVSEAQKSGTASRLHLLHGVPDDDLPALYALADTFVYPSRYEGFGIPIIEAVSMGLPVVACTGSCLEEAGGPDNLYVAPDDVDGLADGIRRTLKGSADREQRVARSQDYVRRFAGNEAAARFLEIYQSLCG